MPADPSFATATELASYTKGKVSASDLRVADMLAGASAAIRRRAGWHVWPAKTQTTSHDTNGGRVLRLKTLRLTAVTAVRVRGVTLDPTAYEWSRLGVVRRVDGLYWPDAFQAVEVDFTSGFEDAADLRQVVLQVVSQALSSPTGATREQAGQVSVAWATTAPGVAGGLSLLERDLAVVDSYRLPGRL